MKIQDVIFGLLVQAYEKERLSGGSPDSAFTREADVLVEAARLIKRQDIDNAPLTLEELRGMDGEAVWVVPLVESPEPEYALVSVANEWLCTSSTDYWEFDVYGRGILAYRRKPDEETT